MKQRHTPGQRRLVVSCLWLALFSTGCGLFATGAPTAQDRSASLHLANQSDLIICDVLLAPRGQRQWGEDRLEPDEAILPDDGKTFYLPAGSWAIRMNDCRGRTLFVQRNLHIRGTRQLNFRPIAVKRDPRFGARRYAHPTTPSRAHF